MRRFELTDDSSNKFWQISIDQDTTLQVSFGKIGHKGQTQLKKLPSSEAALAEMEKLIREKTKKGYVETTPSSSTPLAAPASAPPATAASAPESSTPAPARTDDVSAVVARETPASTATSKPPTLAVGGRFVWTSAASMLAAARPAAHVSLPSPDDATTAIRTALTTAKKDFELASIKWDDATSILRDRILAWLDTPGLPPTVDPELEAAAATLTRSGERAAFVARWLALGGVRTALDVLSRMWGYRQSYESTGGNARPTWLVLMNPGVNWDSSVCSAKADVARTLAHVVQQLPESERDEARAFGAKLREGAPLPVRIGLAWALDDAPFANEDTRQLVALPRSVIAHDAKVLMRVVDDARLLEALVDRFGYDYVDLRPEIIVRRIGIPAAALLGKRLAKAGSRPYEVEVATYLATLECAETARILGGWLDKKGVDDVAKELFARRPDLAFPVLGAALVAGGKPALFAEPVARALVASHGETLDALASELEPKALAALTALRPRAADESVVESPDGPALPDLPRVLASPPWLAPKANPAPPPVIEDIAVLPFEERLLLEAGERELYSRPPIPSMQIRRWYKLPTALEPRSPAMDAAARDKIYMTNLHLASWLDLMSDARVRKFFEEEGEVAARDLRVTASDLSYLLARLGLEALRFILLAGRADPVAAGEALEPVESPRVASFLAETMTRSKKAKPYATAYFTARPEVSAIGLLPAALSKKTQKWALPALQLIASANEGIVRTVAARYGTKVEAALDALLAWEAPTAKPPPLPEWFAPDLLPPVLLRDSGARLPPKAVSHLATLLALSETRVPHDRLDDVKAACTPDSLARFAWALFQMWLAAGANGKEDWAMTALGHLGADDAARRLTPLVRSWPGESAHARAVKGLDVLAQIGSDVALMLLDSVAEKVKFKGLQEKARQKIEEVAQERALSPEQLADRIAPSLDLDADGSRVLSFGARSFRVGFDENLVPFVVDETGKRLTDLPKPRTADDAAEASQATQIWKALKKDAKTVASTQIHRLERAMCSQRRWTGKEMKSLLVEHPLVFHLVRRLLWATYTNDRIDRLFRVAEDRSFADVTDTGYTLADDAIVGLPHRLELTEDDTRAWGELFGSYEILQPFMQLDRDVYAVTDDERAATAIARADGLEVPTRKVIGLESRGWRKGHPEDAGWIWDMEKPLAGNLVACLPVEGGLLASGLAESPEVQKLGSVTVERGQWPSGSVALAELPALVFSELVRDLEMLRG